MPSEITMPQLSDTMTEGTVIKWLKKEGDKVKAGEVIAEIETDKATMEQESFDSGTLAVRVAREGDKVKVGDVIAVLAGSGENVAEVGKQYASGARAGSAAAPAAEAAAAPAPKAEVTAVASNAGSSTATLAAPAKTAERASNNGGGNGHSERIRISPLARRLASERGIDLSQLTGSGPNGRIVQQDVLDFAPESGGSASAPGRPAARAAATGASSVPKAPAAPLPQRMASGQKEVVPLTKMRATIALRLQQSKQQVPHFYETIDVDMDSLVTLREKANKQFEKQGIRLSISDFVNKGIAAALLEHPAVNAHFNGTKNEITRFGDVNLGIAVALPDGLIVPVLRNIGQMGLREIRQRSVDLADRARAGKLKQDEMTGATFTVSTLGAYGVREFGAIINPPEVGILAVGAVEKRPVVRNDQLVARTMMTLTLSVDHRAVDGATAAEFLRTLKGMLEDPGMMLV